MIANLQEALFNRSFLPTIPPAAAVLIVVVVVAAMVFIGVAVAGVEEVEDDGAAAPGAAGVGLGEHHVDEAARAGREHHGRRLRAVRPLQRANAAVRLALRRQARARRRLVVRRRRQHPPHRRRRVAARRQRQVQLQVQPPPAAAAVAPAHPFLPASEVAVAVCQVSSAQKPCLAV